MKFYKNEYYHLYNRTNNKEALFRSREKLVYDVLEEAGLKAPMGDYGYWSERLPLLAGDWGNPNLSIG